MKWFNMREEPVLYINGNPYVVREASKPFTNLEITGKPMQERQSPQHLGASLFTSSKHKLTVLIYHG